jgi:hypothetical protein
VAEGNAVVEHVAADPQGNLESPSAGEVVLSVPSPEVLERDPSQVHDVISRAGTGTQPLVVVVEAAEDLRDQELAALFAAARRTPRPVILRVIREA